MVNESNKIIIKLKTNKFIGVLLMSDEPNINGNVYTKDAVINMAKNLTNKNFGELTHNTDK